MKLRLRVCPAVCLVITVVACLAPDAGAQDSHYWNNQYGPRAMLLSGSVIGSVHDMSGTFYNPGALGYIDQPELLLSANIYQATKIRVEDGGGEGIDLETSKFNLLPNMLAGAVRATWLGKNKIAYSFLTRHRFDAEVKGSVVTQADVLDSPGEEEFVGALLSRGNTKELWAGVTWARGGAGNKVGFGITTYFSMRDQGVDVERFAQALASSGELAFFNDVKSYSFNAYSLLWKAGLGFSLEPFSAGLTLTTPNVQLFGSGRTLFNETRIEIPDEPNGFATNIQEDVKATYKSPLSVGAGAAWHHPKARVHLSAEWFDGIGAYEVLDIESFESQATGELIEPTTQQKLSSVVNVGAGVEYHFNDKMMGFLSFSTDNSAYDPESDVSITAYDLRHLALGVNSGFTRTEFMLGLSYAWGSEKALQNIDLDPGEDDNVIDPEDEVNVIYRRLTFMIGFSVNI